MKDLGKASSEAKRLLQKAKESSPIPEDVIRDIKETHLKFLKEHDGEAAADEYRETNFGKQSPSPVPTQTHKEKKTIRKCSPKFIKDFCLVGCGYLLFLFILLVAGTLFPENKEVRYYANGFYAWFNWQPFDDAVAFKKYPILDLLTTDSRKPQTESSQNSPKDNQSDTDNAVTTSGKVVFDKIELSRDFYGTTSKNEKIQTESYTCELQYPVQIKGYDLTKLREQMLVHCFEEDYKYLGFKEAARKYVKMDRKTYDTTPDEALDGREERSGCDKHLVSLTSSYDASSDWVQYCVYTEEYGWGALHGSYIHYYYIYDLLSQRILTFYDIFSKESKDYLYPIVRHYLIKQDKRLDDFLDKGEGWSFFVSENIRRIEKKGIKYYVFHYGYYDIAPFGYGNFDVEVPEYELSKYLIR